MNKEFVELMLRAPAVPEWYNPWREEPLGPGQIRIRIVDGDPRDAHEEKRLMEWHSYYARQVLKAAGEEWVETEPLFQNARKVMGAAKEPNEDSPDWKSIRQLRNACYPEKHRLDDLELPPLGKTRIVYWNGAHWVFHYDDTAPTLEELRAEVKI